jgi:hypothetical protein
MQSSGASVLAFTLAQKPDSLAFIDIWNMFAAPELDTDRDCAAKVVVTTAFSLETHRKRFRPDVTILVLRHPVDTYDSLFGKSYANDSGLLDEKFARLEEVFRTKAGFDHVVYYEDFAFCPREIIGLSNRIGWQLGYDALLFSRKVREIEETNAAACPDIDRRVKYGSGNISANSVLRDRVRFSQPWGKSAHLPRLCPSLFDHYAELRAERAALWHVPPRALLSCGLSAIVRGRDVSGAIPHHSERAGYKLRLTNGTPQCRVSDTELILCPAASGRETRFTVSGLPGLPFNRICGSASTEHPLALGTTVRIRVEGKNSTCLAEGEISLCHSDMRHFDLGFVPQSSTISVTVGVRAANSQHSSAHAGVCFRNLRLEQVAL